MFVVSWTIHCLLILLSVAFFTLFERKVISLFHLRLGPNKVSFYGLVQPLLDAFKLLTKQDLYPARSNNIAYSFAPTVSLFLALYVWLTMPLLFVFLSLNYSFVVFFFVTSAIVFPVLLSGWSSNSKYSLIGSLRSVAQSISYEAVFSTLIVLFLFLQLSYSIQTCSSGSSSLLFLLLAPIWIICSLAEAHRAPFDFSEAESELVSGFNTEYSGAFFAFIFLSEYSVLLYASILICHMFLSGLLSYFPPAVSVVVCTLATLGVSFFFVWVRVTYCRFRYDLLIVFAWKTLLPASLLMFLASLTLPLLF